MMSFKFNFIKVTLLRQPRSNIINNIYATFSPILCCQMVLLELYCTFDSLSHDIIISKLELIRINGSSLKLYLAIV